VLAYVVLQHAYAAVDPSPQLVRTRDPEVYAKADIVWDVGGVYDPARMRYDHHQVGAETHPDGYRLSAAGLVWRHHGPVAAKHILGDAVGEADIDQVVQGMAGRFVRAIDLTDNGHVTPLPSDLSRIVQSMNPDWIERRDLGFESLAMLQDQSFLAAATLVDTILGQLVRAEYAEIAAADYVLRSHRCGQDARILVMNEALPWKPTARRFSLPVLLAVYPYSSGWVVDTIEVQEGSPDLKLAMPLAWAGLRGQALQAASGLADAEFCHLGRFLAATKTREGAELLAVKVVQTFHVDP